MTACGDEAAQSVLKSESIDTAAGSGTESDEEDYELEVPDAVKNLSPEDDAALTGVLTEDSYTNPYFGIKLNKIEGGTIMSKLDDGTDITPFRESFESGIGSILILTKNSDANCSCSIYALTSNQLGKSEDDLIKETFDQEQSMNEALGEEMDCSIETVSIAGEEHPAYIEIYEDEGITIKNSYINIIKNDFLCKITTYGPVESFDEIINLFEKI